MLYPKFTQRYLAAIVCCLILILGISTLFLVYSFYLRRSPLLVDSLESMVPSIYNGKSKENRVQNTKFQSQIDSVTESTRQNVVKLRRVSDHIEDENRRNKVDKNANQSVIPDWERKKNYSESEDSNSSDTIDIDYFDRNKTNFFTTEKPTFEGRPAAFAEDSFVELSRETWDVGHNRKMERMPLRENVIERSFSNQIQVRQDDLNLDAVYDRNQDSNESFDIAEDEDDEDVDDMSVFGSGSGDSDLRAYAENDRLMKYDMPPLTDLSKDWIDHGQIMRFDLPRYRKNPQKKKNQNKGVKNLFTGDTDNNTKDKKPNKLRSRDKKSDHFGVDIDPESSSFFLTSKTILKLSKNAKDAKNEKRRFATRMKNELASSMRPYKTDEPLVSTTKERSKLSHNNKNKKTKNPDLITTTSAQKAGPASELNDRKLSKSAMRYKERDNEISAKYDGLFDKPTAKDPQMNPATWVETRTRRVLGNVRKSEERSRQLLLCEEAGGGELCRMLFKGHTSE